MEDQQGARSGWSSTASWSTFYIDASLNQLGTQGHAVLDQDVVSPFVRHHLNVPALGEHQDGKWW